MSNADKCGKLYEIYATLIPEKFTDPRPTGLRNCNAIRVMDGSKDPMSPRLDLCPECMTYLLDWLSGTNDVSPDVEIVGDSEWTFDPFDTWTDIYIKRDDCAQTLLIRGIASAYSYYLTIEYTGGFCNTYQSFTLSKNRESIIMSKFEISKCEEFIEYLKKRGDLYA